MNLFLFLIVTALFAPQFYASDTSDDDSDGGRAHEFKDDEYPTYPPTPEMFRLQGTEFIAMEYPKLCKNLGFIPNTVYGDRQMQETIFDDYLKRLNRRDTQ